MLSNFGSPYKNKSGLTSCLFPTKKTTKPENGWWNKCLCTGLVPVTSTKDDPSSKFLSLFISYTPLSTSSTHCSLPSFAFGSCQGQSCQNTMKRIQSLPVCAGFFICIRNFLDRPCVTMPSWSSPLKCKVSLCPFPLLHFASIFFAYLWSFRWPNYIVTLPRYFSFRLPHLNIPTGPPSDELDKNGQRTWGHIFFEWNKCLCGRSWVWVPVGSKQRL
jgi:hypothetical protein